MNPEYKRKWIAALQRDSCKLGKHKLYNPRSGCFCVLGVLANVLVKEQPDVYSWLYDTLDSTEDEWAERYGLPPSMCDLVGLDIQGLGKFNMPITINDKEYHCIATLNDELDHKIDIISVIEKEF